ncbi:hypothetical protein IC762_17675 [Bradyrhizobium genosp. L]|uniref:transcription termination/antitermination protein NusG n=1 Tax=Bradyrhizobium genosp. L TaxID=83637 RepID=UPI0018A2DF7F|nr:transcription termination/antitermination NusG family protein [Bradyrhizobium genosp. L]QPF81656.1 hypothetical protein IC762_17675 [Bradyrhizobium genosp. L]
MTETTKGNLDTVRSALTGITGVEPVAVGQAERYYVIVCRPNHEFEAVDSFRRNAQPAFWPSYEELVTTRQRQNDQPVRRIRRIGIISGYVFTPASPSRDFTVFLQRIVGAIEIAKTFSGAPLVLDEADVAVFRRIEAEEGFKDTVKTEHDFKIGEKVRFRDDLQRRWPPGKIIKLARQGRISVEVAMMGRKMEIKVLPHQIART